MKGRLFVGKIIIALSIYQAMAETMEL